MNHDDLSWRDHRDELFERVVHRGRARRRRRGLGVAAALLTLVLVIGAGLYFPGRGSRTIHVASPANRATTTSLVATEGSAITYAYEHFFDPELTADQRAALIQGGDVLRAFIDRSFADHAAEAAAGAIVVDQITVHGTTADVSFHAQYQGRESPANPGQLNGIAVLEGGTWKIGRVTYCTLSANDGEPCPSSSAG